MELKASAYKDYGEAATMKLVLDALPKIAAEVAAPLAKVDEIVIVGGGGPGGAGMVDETTKLLAELPVNNLSNATGTALKIAGGMKIFESITRDDSQNDVVSASHCVPNPKFSKRSKR